MALQCRVFQSGECEITQLYKQGVHGGMDLVNKNYTEDWIVAHSEGVVIETRTNCQGFEEGGSYGNYVFIRHKDNYYTLYAHLKYGTVKVNVGDNVEKGQVLGYQGATGTAYGTHLHWEVRTPDNVRIDPEPYLNADLPNNTPIVSPVERDTEQNQVEICIDYLRVRTTPSLNGYVLGFAKIGYYNVLESAEADGYTWYKIGEDNWVAYSDEWAKYYPADDYKKKYEEALKEIDLLKQKNTYLQNKIDKAIKDLT